MTTGPLQTLRLPKHQTAMEEERQKEAGKHKLQKPERAPAAKEPHFKPSADVKGVRFGGQFVVKSFTVRRASPFELPGVIGHGQGRSGPDDDVDIDLHFASSTIAYLPTNFTILAHHAWHTLTLGLGTKRSKVLIFVFESEAMRSSLSRAFPSVIPLGDVNRKLIRGLSGCEMARFKFRKGGLTFYVYAVRRAGAAGFSKADDLGRVLEMVLGLKDFVDHTAMLALPNQRSLEFSSPVAMAH